jgi:hypothetical protein
MGITAIMVLFSKGDASTHAVKLCSTHFVRKHLLLQYVSYSAEKSAYYNL